ncbi:MAG: AmmeMemoRadiSam system radical SAM enzyme [Candidatus Falkowbacteria bacterium]|nr:AmmeMemoRadiSam system radical SAM enzyme [Candidatus Falkowbacteria bacterium]
MSKKRITQILAIAFFSLIIALAGVIIFNRERTIKQESASLTNLKVASFFTKLDNGYVQCNLCPNGCVLAPEQTGLCKARKNISGQLYSLVYGKVAAANVDPIEKKPFYHFLPGTTAFSISTTGCNMACNFCQNWDISQKFSDEVITKTMTPEQVVDEALASNAKSIAYTYNEPTIFYEFMLDTAKLAKTKGLKNVMHSNGYINQEPLLELIPYLDAANIDLKGMSDKFYSDYTTNGKVEPVLATIKTLKEKGVWLEITNLLIPGANDSPEEIKKVVNWVKNNLGTAVPLHFSRFFPTYKLNNIIPTPENTLQQAYKIAKDEGLQYVYLGNTDLPEGSTTYCPSGKIAIERKGYFIETNNLTNGKCSDGGEVAGVWQ